MTKVWIELNSDEGLKHPLPIEIRRLNLALVVRSISEGKFELNEGSYFVTSTLPDGRKLFGQGTVTGDETTILLSVDPDYERGESVDLFLPGQKNWAGDLLLQYLANGYLREAAILAQSELFNVLFPGMDHSSQLVLLYTLLRVGELDKLTNKIFDSEFSSPDSSAIRGEVLARLGRHEEAFEAFLELEVRGIPEFTDGVFYATQRLKIYRSVLEMSSLENDISSYSILRRLQRIATHQTSDYPIVAYTGYDLMEPDAVLPLSIGIETLGGIFTKIFDRNTPLPASASQIFSTASDNQTSVEVQLFQGERPMTADNRSLGKFQLAGISPRPRGMPQIEVVFSIDVNGVITVSARDMESDRIQETTLNSSLPAAEINRLRQEAESFSESDLQRLKLVEARNRIEPLIEQVQQASRAGQRDFADLEVAVAKKAVLMEDVDAIERAISRLYETLNRLMEQQFEAIETEKAGEVSAGVETEFDADAEP